MSKTVYEVKVVSGKYIDREGKEKLRYTQIGSVIDTRNGLMLKLSAFPVTDEHWNGWAYLNTPLPKDSAPPKRTESEDDIPF
jgi:hypothetical protein